MSTRGLQLEVLTSDGALERLGPALARLLAREEDHHAFRSFDWLWPWWKAFGRGRALRLLLAREDGEPKALLPLYEERLRTFAGVQVRRVALVGAGPGAGEDLGLVGAAGDRARLAPALVDLLAREVPFDELVLDAVRPEGALACALARRLGDAVVRATPLDDVVAPRARLTGTLETYLARRPGGLARQVERRRRWLEARPGYRLERAETPRQVGPALDTLVRLHRLRFAERSTTFEGPMEGFLREVAERLAARGALRLRVLHAEGAPVAAVLGWRWGDTYAYYQSGHDPAWRGRSVGTVLLAHCLAECFAEGVAVWDFLRGEEAYKAAWVDGRRRYRRVLARGPRPLARAALTLQVQGGRAVHAAARLVRAWRPTAGARPR